MPNDSLGRVYYMFSIFLSHLYLVVLSSLDTDYVLFILVQTKTNSYKLNFLGIVLVYFHHFRSQPLGVNLVVFHTNLELYNIEGQESARSDNKRDSD